MKGDWVLVSPHRLQRPWSGQVESQNDKTQLNKESNNLKVANPLCPGAQRPNGQFNPDYTSTFVFENDFPALLPDIPDLKEGQKEFQQEELFRFRPAKGTCRVMCFHPESDKTIPLMSIDEIIKIVEE